MPSAIKSLEILDQAEGPFQKLVDLAAVQFGCSAAVVTLMTPTHAVIRSNNDQCARRISHEESLVPILLALEPKSLLIVPDVQLDTRVSDHRLVKKCPQLHFIAMAPIHGPSGKAIGGLTLLHDGPLEFCEAKRQQLQLMASMADDFVAGVEAARIRDERIERLRLVEQMSGVGNWRLERDTGRVEMSDTVRNMYDELPDCLDLDSQKTVAILENGDVVSLRELVDTAFEKGKGYVAKLIVSTEQGERRFETRAEIEKNEDGQAIALQGVFQDVTERDRGLAMARKNEARYRLLAENVGDVLTRVKRDGTSKYISPAIQTVLGWTYEEMSGQSMDYVYPEDRYLVIQKIAEAVKTGEPVMKEFRAVHRKGHIVWVECTFRAVRDDNGFMDDVIVVIRDISSRKALEDEVIVAKEKAEQATAAKSEFLANMSHELRTPLTSVIGFSGLLMDSKALPEKERVYAERISTASEALLGVINDILDYSKLEAHAIEMDPEIFELKSLVEGAAAIIERQCLDKGLSLAVEVDPVLPECLNGDMGRLRQVILNFLSNAVKFTSIGGVSLKATGVQQSDGLWRLRVSVTDSGIGIPAEKLGQLFDRFTQADASTTRVYGGTGLGLAISQRLIHIMGGEIGVDTRPGEGACFWFEVPVHHAELGVLRIMPEPLDRAGLKPARILMADDAPANRELVTAILSGLGLEVHTVQDGAEAVQAMQVGGYDLVLMDVHMPVMDGLTATREIRRMQAGRGLRTPILALTANVQAEQVARCLDSGMDGHLAKPIQIPEMVSALTYWLASPQQTAVAV